jgi:hypothetical protein
MRWLRRLYRRFFPKPRPAMVFYYPAPPTYKPLQNGDYWFNPMRGNEMRVWRDGAWMRPDEIRPDEIVKLTP